MRIQIALSLSCAIFVTACATHDTPRTPSAVKTPEQVLQESKGFVLKERHAEFLRYSFRDQGEFLISTQGFKNRPQAEGFCSVRDGFELSDFSLPGLMAKTSFPFSELKRSNAVSQRVLSRSRSGLLFWIKGSTVDEEASISQHFDNVLELYDDCKVNCTGIGRLKAINGRIAQRRGKAKLPHAICVSSKLKRKLASQYSAQ